MVKKIRKSDKEAIAHAIAEAERTTSAELACVLAPASDPYQQYVFLYSFMMGSLIAFGLWEEKILTAYPLLLMVQLAAIIAGSVIPPLRRLYLQLVPKHMRYRRAAHRAFEEYLSMSQHVPVNTPAVLLYVSIAERYAHILHNHKVREAISDKAWTDIISQLTAAAPSTGIRNATTLAINQASILLAKHFPKN